MSATLRFGKPVPYNYDTIIDQFSGTKINSVKTSSIPLVQFWKNFDLRLTELAKSVKWVLGNPLLCFEYPTSSKGRGKSSMTDLMILDGDLKIAIEAKYTEYLKKNKKIETIEEWQGKKNEENRKSVLKHWTDLIRPFSIGLDEIAIQKIEYQFFHRTASACFGSRDAKVLYQVFYDAESKSDMDELITDLRSYIKLIKPNNKLSFYVWMVEAKLKIKDEKNIDPFTLMKFKDIYEFASDKIIQI